MLQLHLYIRGVIRQRIEVRRDAKIELETVKYGRIIDLVDR